MQEPHSNPGNATPASSRSRFPRARRRLRHGDFERVYRQGRRYLLPDMAVFYMFTAATAGAISQGCGLKIGLTVPQSLGGAVQRNRIKRRMREALRLSLPALAGEVAADVVLHPRRSVATLPFPELLQEVKQALESVQARKGSARAPGAQRMKAKP